jgi:iron complex transport system substrate-binding protein
MLLLLALAPACSAPPPGAAVSAPRIVSLVPAVTEMLFAMGAGPQVVGVSSFDRFPPEVRALPSVGALVDPDFERILTLRPDLVVVYGSQDELMQRLEQAGIGYYRYRHTGLADVMETMRAVGARVGHADEAEGLAARVERDLDAVRQAVAGRPRPPTALVFGREPGALRAIYASGGVGFLHDLLELAGGDDVFADVRRENLQVSTETLLARAPDVIVELRTTEAWTAGQVATERQVWRALPSLPAVRDDRIYILTDASLGIPGPRVADSARALAAVLHPDAAVAGRSLPDGEVPDPVEEPALAGR